MREWRGRSLLYAALILGVAAAGGSQGDPPVTRITLERTECKGTCPVYKVSFEADGTVTYVGQKHVARIGTFTGRIDRRTFGRLVELLQSFHYDQLQDHYTAPITDHPHAITSVSWGARRKTIDDYAEAGPAPLWGFELALDAVTARVENWTRVSARGAVPGSGPETTWADVRRFNPRATGILVEAK